MNLLHISFALIFINVSQGDIVRTSNSLPWPGTGLKQCLKLVDLTTREACTQCFTDAANNILKRANVLYNVGLPLIMKVVHSNNLKDGPAAIMSSMAQKVLFSRQDIKDSIKDLNHNCSERFKTDTQNAEWHLPNSRKEKSEVKNSLTRQALDETIVYQYGIMGHDMPFHGVGPLAVDILKGKCLLNHVSDNGKLQNFVAEVLEPSSPMPAWIFQEIVKDINSIELP
ncbi:hypothetical protein Pmani_029858 [Petrolisthes manimaculis]|uniref:Uncharacterized protein n=1 Tax=Petrolisthes manimaculis TaxID=1843537 RepID=A0AAE1TWJ6_9EUCA|nr:hypothetical protein Pmani_029858 [Petrolisthes manimaculis]